ncbi:hypothetical protein ACQKJ1_05320 [Methylorubrum rhodesianum]|uniref:hypothetical protein n=1 Tax=Methylorubrum rhodesianum TaxID=29427 RepID=UPI003D052CE4
MIDTRHWAQCIKRKRLCVDCGKRWNTTESADSLMASAAAGQSTEKVQKTQHLARSASVTTIYDTRAHTAAILNSRRPLLRD